MYINNSNNNLSWYTQQSNGYYARVKQEELVRQLDSIEKSLEKIKATINLY